MQIKGENCIVQKISSPKLEQTIRADIIKKAAFLVENAKNKKKEINKFYYLMNKVDVKDIDKKWQDFWSSNKKSFKNTDKKKNFTA